MADVSLDEFIRQKNVKPQTGKGRANGQQRTAPVAQAKFQNKKPVTGFDARSKLGPKPVSDARDKILTIKKSGKGDARNKIVQKQVQKGTFDARSLIQRQGQKGGNKTKNGGTGGQATYPPGVQQLTRTLSNPNVAKGQIKVTNSGLQVTRRVPNTEISMSGNSLQVTKRMPGGPLPMREDAVPIIQIRNDKYQQKPPCPPNPPFQQPSYTQYSSRTGHGTSYADYSYSSSGYSNPPQRRQYRDLDDPENNAASVELAVLPKVHISNIKNVEAAGMRPVARPLLAQQRAPPGAATLSVGPRAHVPKMQLPPAPRLQTAGVKRRQQPLEMAGPLKLGRGGGPGIQIGIGDPSPPKKTRANLSSFEDVEIMDGGDKEIVSPLQGFRVVVTNLFTGVTQDDIIELFGVVGPLKKARLLKPGAAEVVYSNREDALKAVQKYHSRELDGQPMYVKMTTPSAAVIKMPLGDLDPDITGEALRLYKKPGGLGALPVAPIEVPTIHRALFKVGPPAPNKSVKFTVKI